VFSSLDLAKLPDTDQHKLQWMLGARQQHSAALEAAAMLLK